MREAENGVGGKIFCRGRTEKNLRFGESVVERSPSVEEHMYFFMSRRRVAELDIDMDAEQETFLEAWRCGGTLSQCGQQLG